MAHDPVVKVLIVFGRSGLDPAERNLKFVIRAPKFLKGILAVVGGFWRRKTAFLSRNKVPGLSHIGTQKISRILGLWLGGRQHAAPSWFLRDIRLNDISILTFLSRILILQQWINLDHLF